MSIFSVESPLIFFRNKSIHTTTTTHAVVSWLFLFAVQRELSGLLPTETQLFFSENGRLITVCVEGWRLLRGSKAMCPVRRVLDSSLPAPVSCLLAFAPFPTPTPPTAVL
jgi:hypothetical protein